MGKAKPYTWVCETCNKSFRTRALLHEHWKQYPEHHIIKSSATHKGEYYCKYCNNFFDQLNSLHLHEKHCKYNPNRIDGASKGKKMSNEFKIQHSILMKERHKTGKAPTFADLRKTQEPSYPEKWLMTVINNEGIDNNYVREHKFHTFSLDFYWPDKKKVIEMDGRLHKTSEYQKDCDKRKDLLLAQEGYDELRIDWEYCYNNPKEVIQKIKNFINGGVPK